MTDHSQLPNPAQLEIRNLKEEMRQRAERFNNNKITVERLLHELSSLLRMKNKL